MNLKTKVGLFTISGFNVSCPSLVMPLLTRGWCTS